MAAKKEEINKPLIYFTIAATVLTIIWAIYRFVYLPKQFAPPPSEPIQVACTDDAKICLDGSTVGRVGSNCEFETCPVEVATESALIQ